MVIGSVLDIVPACGVTSNHGERWLTYLFMSGVVVRDDLFNAYWVNVIFTPEILALN